MPQQLLQKFQSFKSDSVPVQSDTELLCRLIEGTSANGNRYFTGYLGEAKVILLADKDTDPEKLYAGIAACR